MSIARVTIIRLHETPKFLLGQNRDDEVVSGLQAIADKYHRPFSLTAEKLSACGPIIATHQGKRFSPAEFLGHIRGLFATRRLTISTILIWSSWTLIGLAYPLYFVFLPTYLATRGSSTGESGNYYTWRNYVRVSLPIHLSVSHSTSLPCPPLNHFTRHTIRRAQSRPRHPS